jgi:CO/xanthine dehydrogenase FAD-binding subunit
MSISAHPELPEFEYIRPASLAEASRFLVEHAEEARPFLGGTDVFVRMRDGFISPRYLLDVKNLDGTGDIQFDPQIGLTIGSAVNMNRVIGCQPVIDYYSVLAEACRSVASYQLRTRATIIGNICNASPAGDTIGACLVYEGTLCVHGMNGERQLTLDNFFLGPGKTVLEPGEIVTAIRFPIPARGSVGCYLKLGRNRLSDLSIVGVTVLAHPTLEYASGYRFRIALASVAPIPLDAYEAEEYLSEHPIDDAAFEKAARLAQASCKPIDDVRGSVRYRKAMVYSLTLKGLRQVWAKLKRPVG